MLGLIQTITLSFSSFNYLLMLHPILVRSELQDVSIVWNSISVYWHKKAGTHWTKICSPFAMTMTVTRKSLQSYTPWMTEGTTLMENFAQMFIQVQNSVNFFHLLKAPEFSLTILGTSPCLPLLVKTVFFLPVLQLLTWCAEVLTETFYVFKTNSDLIWYNLNDTDLGFLFIQPSLSFIITFCVLIYNYYVTYVYGSKSKLWVQCNLTDWHGTVAPILSFATVVICFVLFSVSFVFVYLCCICVAVLAL